MPPAQPGGPDAGPAPTPPVDAEARAKLDAATAQLAQQQQQIEAQRQALAQQQSALDELKKQLAADRAKRDAAARQAAAHQVAEAPAVRSAWPQVDLTGFVQADYARRQSSQDQLNGSTDEPLNQDRFLVRRGRLKVLASYQHVSLSLEGGFNTVHGAQARLVSTELSWRVPGDGADAPPVVMGTLGLFKIPFGYEVVQSDRDRLFLERSNAERALFPGEYDVGARISGGWRFVRYALAVQNGEPVGERSFPGRDPNSAKDIVGRVGIDTTLDGGRLRVVGGASVTTGKGFSPGAPATKPVLVWRDNNANGVVDPGEVISIPGQAAVPSTNFSRFAVGGDLRIVVNLPGLGDLDLYGEMVSAKNLDRAFLVADPVSASRDLRELGWYVAATQRLGSLLQVGVRYDKYDPDADATNYKQGNVVRSNLSVSTLSATGALLFEHSRVILEADINRNHEGLDMTGQPTNLADDVVTLRGEVDF